MDNKNATPIIIDLGKQKRARIKQLKQGHGPLLNQVRAAGQLDGANGDSVIPVVILYEKKKRKRRYRVPLLGPM
jgi:hypothetical protein